MSSIFQSIEDRITDGLDLNDLVVKNPSSTFFMSVSGNDLEEYNLFDKDILVIDRALDPQTGKLIIVAIDGELKVIPFVLDKMEDSVLWGVVTHVIHKL